MIKKAFGWLLNQLIKCFSHDLSAQDTRYYIEEQYQDLLQKKRRSASAAQDMAVLQGLLDQLNWLSIAIDKKSSPQNKAENLPGFNQINLQNYFERGVLQPGCGRYLDWLQAHPHGKEGQIEDEILEKILRHVEVKRENALQVFSQELPAEQKWLERCDISILFSRSARRKHDLRFLNAALKMNEWYIRAARRSVSDEGRLRLLVALAEQEISARELLAC